VNQPTFLIVDLFCGFGGTTLGYDRAKIDGEKVAKVIACVNHDPKAINSHFLNHPDVLHFTEDIRTLELGPLVDLVRKARIQYPDAYVVLWASLECTNHSKAKGGLPRDADSRTLANDLFRYQEAIDPDFVKIENVVEFMAWGPLDADGKPISRKNGQDWVKWRADMCSRGYYDEWKELNSANFGAYTSRNRLFGCFAKHGLPITWPEPTHSKKVRPGMFGSLAPWKAVKDVLNFEEEGKSIFDREKPLVEKTLERIYAGLIKYVAGGEKAFMQHIYACSSDGVNNHSLEQPGRTVTTRDARALVQPTFLANFNHSSKANSIEEPSPTLLTHDKLAPVKVNFLANYKTGNPSSKVSSIEKPMGVLTCIPTQSILQADFLYKYYSNGNNLQSISDPLGTVPTKDRFVKVGAHFLDKQYGSGKDNHQSVETAGSTLTGNPKLALYTTFLINRQFKNNGCSTDAPCPVIIASQDKRPLYLVQLDTGEIGIEVYESDSPMTRKIKEFMALYGIVDIKMRMLMVSELLKIQGFPEQYHMVGNQSDHKKFIGNSVVPGVVKAWAEAMAKRLSINFQKQA
jgi:DNA (cytosine-5)-methyltransferase 1